jgi:hypothetical protein
MERDGAKKAGSFFPREMQMFGRLDGEGRDTIDISLDKLAQIVLLARAYDAQTPESDPDEASNASDDGLVSVLEAQVDNPIGQELREAIESLSDDEQAVLVALTWIGRGDFECEELDKAITLAFERRQGSTIDYLLGVPLLGDLIEQGAAACGIGLSDEEAEELYHPDSGRG